MSTRLYILPRPAASHGCQRCDCQGTGARSRAGPCSRCTRAQSRAPPAVHRHDGGRNVNPAARGAPLSHIPTCRRYSTVLARTGHLAGSSSHVSSLTPATSCSAWRGPPWMTPPGSCGPFFFAGHEDEKRQNRAPSMRTSMDSRGIAAISDFRRERRKGTGIRDGHDMWGMGVSESRMCSPAGSIFSRCAKLVQG